MKCLEVRNGVTIAITKDIIPIIITTNSRPQYNKTQENKTGKTWGQKGKDSKITLTQESSHFVPEEFSNSFFKQFDLAMKIKREGIEEAR